MQDEAADIIRPLPPVTTQFGGATGLPASGDVRLVRPVVGEPTYRAARDATAPEATAPPPADVPPWEEIPEAPVQEPQLAAIGEPASEAEAWQAPGGVPEVEPPADREFPWELPSDEGTVEPAFEADVADTEAALAAIGEVPRDDAGAFPLDAFIIPEHPRHVPTGLEGHATTTQAPHTPITDLADRLEKLSHRLRIEDTQATIGRLAAGDRLDTMLAGLLAGFLAAQK